MLKIIQGDCLIKLKELPDNSVDSIVTDPPAGISFMGKSWDSDKGGRDKWIKWMSEVATECKRVLKPGGHAFVWAIPRTSHWTATAWENAGFEIRDVVAHIFGSGFPKSLNIGKAVDKLQGNERKIVGEKKTPDGKTWSERRPNGDITGYVGNGENKKENTQGIETKGNSEWEGWGTALKPAREDWLLMRKPLEKGLNVAENCLKWGTGGINIDESRVPLAGEWDKGTMGTFRKAYDDKNKTYDGTKGNISFGGKELRADRDVVEKYGRFPANLILSFSENEYIIKDSITNEQKQKALKWIYENA